MSLSSFNILKVTNYKIKGGNFQYAIKFSLSLKLGYTIRGSVLIQDKYSLTTT